MTKSLFIAISASLQFACSPAISDTDNATSRIETDLEILEASYQVHAFTRVTAIPDNRTTGVTMGPVGLPHPTQVIRDILLRVEISHFYAGDLSIWLHYDVDGDGDFDASTPIDIHLARPESWIAEELYSCPIELQSAYHFKDDGWQEAGEDASLTTVEGLPAGGDFYLSLIDSAQGNTGSVSGWAIYVQEVDKQRPAGLAGDLL